MNSATCTDSVRADALTKCYGGKAAVDGVSFAVPPGALVSFIGPNGAGKSTVMGLLSRLIARDSGSVELSGSDIARWKRRAFARRLAILTQEHAANAHLTVRELVSFGRFPHSGGRLSVRDRELIDRAIACMDLESCAGCFIDELSGGQRQLAYIAMVIAQDTEYLLLDEPTNNLDIAHARLVMRTMRRLCDDMHRTVLLVLHDINYAAFYSDYICALKDGKVLRFGTAQEVLCEETLSLLYGADVPVLDIGGTPLSLYY